MKAYYYIFCLFLLTACVEQLNFDLDNSDERYLVVDGFITNLNGPHEVRLSYSAPYKNTLDGGREEPITDAIVTIIDELGNTYRMFHAGLGKYRSTFSFKGNVGQQYKLQVKVGEEIYESSFNKLPQPSSVDDVTYSYVQKEIIENDQIKPVWGLEFYADFSFDDNERNYLLDWEGTYIFPTPFYIYSGISCENGQLGPGTCYTDDSDPGWVDVFSYADNNATEAKKIPISFTQVDRRFLIKYSYNVVLYTANEEGFRFHDLVHIQANTGGSVFDPTPSRIEGNMHNINNPDELVLGYFGVFGASSERIFLVPDDIPTDIDGTVPSTCVSPDRDPSLWCCSCLEWPNSTSNRPLFWE